jgi:pyrroline-5-carboxylate reductase
LIVKDGSNYVLVVCHFPVYSVTSNIFYFSDNVTKDKSQGSLFRSVLKCIPHLIEEVGRNDKMTDIIPQHGISIDPGVREEAVQVLNRIVRFLPNRRFAVLKGMANFILKLP